MRVLSRRGLKKNDEKGICWLEVWFVRSYAEIWCDGGQKGALSLEEGVEPAGVWEERVAEATSSVWLLCKSLSESPTSVRVSISSCKRTTIQAFTGNQEAHLPGKQPSLLYAEWRVYSKACHRLAQWLAMSQCLHPDELRFLETSNQGFHLTSASTALQRRHKTSLSQRLVAFLSLLFCSDFHWLLSVLESFGFFFFLLVCFYGTILL